MIVDTKSDLKFHINVNGRFIKAVNSLNTGLNLAMSEDWYELDFKVITNEVKLADTKKLVNVKSVVLTTSGGLYEIAPVVNTSVDYEAYMKAMN